MDIETAEGVKPHGFHLGTDIKIARQFAFEALNRAGTLSAAIRGDNGKLVEILDYRCIDIGE
jgi:hypothetical protein